MFEILDAIKAFFLGIIEGVTEWLPVSSTGHMLIFDALFPMGVSAEFKEVFLCVIQLGAICAVVLLFWNRMWPFQKREEGKPLVKKTVVINWLKVALACVPGVIAEFLIGDLIPETPAVIAAMLILYGAVFIVLETWNAKRKPTTRKMNDITWLTALEIGLFQILAVVPGTSRSGATIIGALLLGVSRTAAVEFTFFLAVPVMLGMSGLKLVKYGFAFSGAEIAYLLIGVIVAFVVSLLVIRAMLNFIRKHNFKPFGYYRIALGALILLLLAVGVLH